MQTKQLSIVPFDWTITTNSEYIHIEAVHQENFLTWSSTVNLADLSVPVSDRPLYNKMITADVLFDIASKWDSDDGRKVNLHFPRTYKSATDQISIRLVFFAEIYAYELIEDVRIICLEPKPQSAETIMEKRFEKMEKNINKRVDSALEKIRLDNVMSLNQFETDLLNRLEAKLGQSFDNFVEQERKKIDEKIRLCNEDHTRNFMKVYYK